ncbi:hypothetical protein ACFSQ7_41250 [Paenibacillus rhizoplanae]
MLDILNKLYNNELFKQEPSPQNMDLVPSHLPRVLVCDDITKKPGYRKKAKYPEALLLFLLNQKDSTRLALGIYIGNSVKWKKYSYIQQSSALDVLIDQTNENPDPLIKLLFAVNKNCRVLY